MTDLSRIRKGLEGARGRYTEHVSGNTTTIVIYHPERPESWRFVNGKYAGKCYERP